MPKKPETVPIIIRGLPSSLWTRFRLLCVADHISAAARLRELIAEDVIAREVLIEAAKTARRERGNE